MQHGRAVNKTKTRMIQFYLIFIWMWTFARTGAHGQIIDDDTDKTPLTQCCKEDYFYRPGLDRCLYRTVNPKPGIKSPVLYAVDENDTFLVDEDIFQISYNLPACPIGSVATSTNDFQVFIDGSLQVEDVLLSPGEFCINQIPTLDITNPEFVARFCVPDPCVGKNTKCLRKCCQQGWAIDMATHSCQPHSTPFNVSQLTKKSGGPIDIDDEESLILHDGLGFKCHNEDIIHVDNFVISSDGMLSNREFTYFSNDHVNQPPTDRYCIDNFIDTNNIPKLMGLKCSPAQLPPISVHMIRASIVYPYLLFVSSFFLFATFVVYAALPGLRNTTGICVMCFVVSMAVYYVGFGVLQIMNKLPKTICVSLPVLVHFACLATFCWLNILCFDYWWKLRSIKANRLNQRNKKSRRLIFYCLYAWGVPLLIVAAGQVLEKFQLFPDQVITPNFDESRCWFLIENRPSLFAYLYGPVTITFLGNTIFFFLIIISMCTRNRSHGDESVIKRPTLGLRVILSLFMLMGALWMTESFSFLVEESLLTLVITDILNILTGVFIFAIFVCKKAVLELVFKKCPCLRRHRRNVFNPRLAEKPSNSSFGSNPESRFTSYNFRLFHRSKILSQLSTSPTATTTASSSLAALDDIISDRAQVEMFRPASRISSRSRRYLDDDDFEIA